ncbi:MAG TPA: Nif3-like dinuclear metal center hexameric protein [Bryobacteraceae bacterium]|nr:Nif3-like dinuclear metal center hexameric protein [Bryobacteraceae bacterium]
MRIAALTLLAFSLNILDAQTQPLTAQQVIERIQKNVGVPWAASTVDTIKAGDPNTPVTGVAVTMMATLDVIERAAAAGKNLVITHEPTFYSHQDQTAELEKQNDAVFAQKAAFIREHHMVVFRFHDHWHRRKPDGIQQGMTDALGWQSFQNAADPHLFVLPETTLADLAAAVKRKLGIVAMRVVGDPQMRLTKVALMPGAGGSQRQIQMLERENVEALLIGEVPEWETVEYVADAVTEHKRKALLMLTHIPSEQAGMDECATWLKTFISEVPVEFVPARQPFWLPK